MIAEFKTNKVKKKRKKKKKNRKKIKKKNIMKCLSIPT